MATDERQILDLPDDDCCDLATMDPDDTWLRASSGRGLEIHSHQGVSMLAPTALWELAQTYRDAAQEDTDDGSAAFHRWDFWTDAAEALGFLQPDSWRRTGLSGRRLYRAFMARVDDCASDLANLVGTCAHGALSVEEWRVARGTLLYLRCEAMRVEPRTFGDDEATP